MGLTFAKYQGAGNDFLVVDAASDEEVSASIASKLCDRRFGVGGDGVLLVLPPRTPGALARMKVINADGSVPEMCGNGLRCVALHLARRHHRAELVVETDAGEKPCVVEDGPVPRVRISMGHITVMDSLHIEAPLQAFTFTVANAGNPHVVTFDPWTREVAESVGPFVEKHRLFRHGTNVEFARLTKDGIELVVWERGVGITHACGTGACATVAVAVSKGMVAVGVPCAVHLPGGTLTVTIDARSEAILEGPAVHVYSGTLAESTS